MEEQLPHDLKGKQGVDEQRLRAHIETLMSRLVKSSFGEGERGMVVQFEDPRFAKWCAKYQKFSYDPAEYLKLRAAYAAGKSVPEPWFEMPDRQLFVMERLSGKTAEQLVREGIRFSPEVVEEIEETVRDFNEIFAHNDLRRDNIFIEDPVVEEKVLVSGTPFLIDLERATSVKQGKKADEYRLVKRLFAANMNRKG